MKNIFKNKVTMFLFVSIVIVLLLDIIINGILRTHLGLDSVRAMTEDPTKLIQTSIGKKVSEWLTTPTTADSISITIGKSWTIQFVYYFTLIIGILELGLAGGSLYFALKEEGTTKTISLVAISLLAVLGIYGIVAGIIKISSQSKMTFEYTLTSTDIATITSTREDMVSRITAEITRQASLPANQQSMMAKIGELMTENSALTPEQAQGLAAQELFGLTARNAISPMYGNLVGNYIGNLSGSYFRTEISNWLSNTAFQEYLTMVLSGTGLVGLLSASAIGYRLSIN